MKIAGFFLNLPWTLLGLLSACISFPIKLKFSRTPLGAVVYVKNLWWLTWQSGRKGTRAVTIGHVVLMTTSADMKDLAHELIHVQQFERAPLIQPFLYFYQSLKYGNRQNKFEREAYDKSGSRYIEK